MDIEELIIESKFINDIAELEIYFSTQKVNLVKFLKNNFRADIHYIIQRNLFFGLKKNGGRNKINYMLTNETLELVKNTFNLKNRYVTRIGDSRYLNIIMSLENQTIGFIANSFKSSVEIKRQKMFKNEFNEYRVDLYFPTHNLVVECDENNHEDRNLLYEKEREKYILSLGNTFIRFNPNDKLFDLSFVFREINKILFSREKIRGSVITVNYCEEL